MLHFPPSLHVEFLQHLFRIVRPGISEHEVGGNSSRVVRHSAGSSKVLVSRYPINLINFINDQIPIAFSSATNEVFFIGYPICFSPQLTHASSFRTVEIVVDYDPPLDLLSSSRLDRRTSISLFHQSFRRVSRDFVTPPTPQETRILQVETPDHSQFFTGDFNSIFPSLTLRSPTLYGTPAPIGTVPIHPIEVAFPPQPVSLKRELFELRFGHYESKGRRPKMEDRTVATPDLHFTVGLPPLPDGETVSIL